jgi:general secretion pathway protein D
MHTILPGQTQTTPSAPRCEPAPRLSALRLIAVLALPAALLAACSTYKPTVPPSGGHISADTVTSPEEKARILPPVTSTTTFIPPPKPRTKPTTYSVVVHEVPVKELLLALARDTKENIDVHPGLSGLVSLNAIDETLPSILERIARQVNMRYRVETHTIVVMPDTPYHKTYAVDYVNMTRDTTSTIAVSGQIGTGAAGSQSSAGGTSQTSVNSTSKNNFWELLRDNVEDILASSRKLSQGAEEHQARAEATKAAREQKLAQAEAVARAGPGASTLFKEVFGPEALRPASEVKQDIVVNQIAGTVTVLASERQHGLIQQYLDSVQAASTRQVLIECTIAEVSLSQTYQAGVDWQKLVNGGAGFNIEQQMLGTALGDAPRMVIGYGLPGSDVFASLRLLEQFGKTRVLSSPKLMALNNQTALLKVVDNIVYFTIQSSISQGAVGQGNLQSVTTTPNTVAVGVVLSLTPQISENGMVTLTVRPTISRVQKFVPDPNPLLQVDSQGNPLPDPLENLVPQISVREMESVLQLVSSQTAVLGGLIQDNVKRNRDQVPYVGNLPRVGDAFAFRDEAVDKSELVIFLRPTVVRNPSLDSDELKHLRRLLPEIDQTGNRP